MGGGLGGGEGKVQPFFCPPLEQHHLCPAWSTPSRVDGAILQTPGLVELLSVLPAGRTLFLFYSPPRYGLVSVARHILV